ncbi:MAG: 50S ribosomal protein L21 [Pseudomonadota bacterium]
MYAVIQTGGKQYRVVVGDVIRVEKLEVEAGDNLSLSHVLMVNNNGEVRVGSPVLSGASVTAKVRSHGRGEKIHIFKMRRRKNYRRSQGHRQDYTEIEITAIQ